MNSRYEKLSALRNAMKENSIDAYLIPSSDPHLSEYLPDHWKVIGWLTGFTGSSADVIVTESFAGLWTDSRYFIQAANELTGSGFTFMKPEGSQFDELLKWICDNLQSNNKLGFDGNIFPLSRYRKMLPLLTDRGISIESRHDLINDIWNGRPSLPEESAIDHSIEFCGKERALKIEEVREMMRKSGADYSLLTSPDDIMWLLNIRGSDVRYNPVLFSFAIAGLDQVLLFADEKKIPFRLAIEFDRIGVVILPYEEITAVLGSLEGSRLLLNPAQTSLSLYSSIPSEISIIEELSIPSRLKSVKNNKEIENLQRTMISDGLALTDFFFWLEHQPADARHSELSLADKLCEFRSKQENFISPSFSTIVAFGKNGAMPHYSANPDSASIIEGKGLLLIDSGGQYHGGTTDITRTISIGKPSKHQVRDFTLVLKGNISLSTARFPEGTRGSQLDILARKSLWDNGLNYGHGTGHGVGFCLSVHEIPPRISPVNDPGNIIKPGMVISNEPAVYREGEYGIRIENLIICCEDEENEFGNFLRFEALSLCYIDKSLIDLSLLDVKEIKWINSYHQTVYDKLSSFLGNEEKKWLREKTSEI